MRAHKPFLLFGLTQLALACGGDSAAGDGSSDTTGGDDGDTGPIATMTVDDAGTTGDDATTGVDTTGGTDETTTGAPTTTDETTTTSEHHGRHDDGGMAVCGNGVPEFPEQCDDGNGIDTDDCTNACTIAVCGDGIVWQGEACDDANNQSNDACVAGCVAAFCGDGYTYAGVEECDDADLDDTDNCTSACISNLALNVLLCGNSQRDVKTFLPDDADLTVVNSCIPDANTQAMLISRQGELSFDGPTVQAYVQGGGIVLTEFQASDTVFNAMFGTAVVANDFIGGCLDTAATVEQFTAADAFWQDNAFQAIMLNESGCGSNVAAFPELVPLAGWSATEVSIGYRDLGSGRVWITDFDWQDTNTVGAGYAYTEQLLGYMIINGQ